MSDKIITLENLKTFKNKCDETYLDKFMAQLTCEYRIVSNFSTQSIPLSDFNRTPIVGESFTIIVKYTGNSKYYYCILTVNSVNSSVAQCSFTQYTMIETTVDTASSSTLGGIKLGYTSSATKKAVVLDSSNRAYVNIPEATDSTSGLMSSTDCEYMLTFRRNYALIDNDTIVTEKTFKSSKTGMTNLYYQVITAWDAFSKLLKISGTIKVNGYTSTESYKYHMIYPSEFNSQLGFVGIGIGSFLKGWWWGTKDPDSTLDIFGYGTAMSVQNTSYLGLGRIYTSTGSYGNWAQDTFKNNLVDGIVNFEMWFSNVTVQ